MRKLLLILLAGLFGCSGFQITDSATNKVLAYASGKLMSIGISEAIAKEIIGKQVDSDLTSAWVDMMERNAGNESVESMEMIAFYNHCVSIIAGPDFDRYGLIGDLSMLLTIYGAEMADDGRMTMIAPVPLVILQTFEVGYSNGRAVAKK